MLTRQFHVNGCDVEAGRAGVADQSDRAAPNFESHFPRRSIVVPSVAYVRSRLLRRTEANRLAAGGGDGPQFQRSLLRAQRKLLIDQKSPHRLILSKVDGAS